MMIEYQPYRLQKIKDYILNDLGKDFFYEDAPNQSLATLEYAKVLFFVGEY